MTSNLNCEIRLEGSNLQLFDLVSITIVAKMSAPKHKIPSNLWTCLFKTLICHESSSSKNNLDIQHTGSPPALPVQRSFAFDPDIENQMGCPDLFEDSLTLPCGPENNSGIEMTVNHKIPFNELTKPCFRPTGAAPLSWFSTLSLKRT